MQPKDWEKVEAELTETWNGNDKGGNFKLKEGDELVGVYSGMEENVGPNNSNLYSFKRPDGEFISVWGSTLLDARFKTLQLGDEVRVVYKGKVKSEKSGRSYHNYDIYHREPVKQETIVEDGQ